MLNFKNILLCVQFPKTWEYKPFIKFFLLVVIYILAGRGFAQNLVFNSDFEIFDTCPTNLSQPLDFQIEHATGWYAPTEGTSDYFNICNLSNAGIPLNLFGYQNPFNGSGYCGFYANQLFPAYSQCFNGEFSVFYREYIQTKLMVSLEANKSYKMTYYISLADTVGGYAIKNIGALFTSDSIGFNCFKPIIANPQIESPDFVTDNINWTKVEGEFIALGGEQYLTIGNFADTLNFVTDTLCVKPDTDWQDGSGIAYYYVDGITLELKEDTVILENNSIIIPNIFTPNKDGNNDLFYLNFLFEQVQIFNRWGQKLFESSNNEYFWDGRTNSGKEVPEGTYYYLITTKEEIYKGFIQLLK